MQAIAPTDQDGSAPGIDQQVPPMRYDSPLIYEHTPLDTTEPQIRLLVIHPSVARYGKRAREFSVQCSIKTFYVDQAPEYVTLSYVWGPPEPVYRILLDGRDFEVRENLFNFLEMYQNDDHNTHYLWIDQLCIDQSNALEKNDQVKMMSRIYRNCQSAVAWLRRPVLPGYEELTQRPDGSLSKISMQILLGNEYFTRLWIVQEIVLSPKVYLMYGRNRITWTEFAQDQRLFTDRRYRNILPLIVTANGLISRELHDVLGYFCTLQCQDARDKVYGVLSLVGGDQELPEVDYRKSTLEVFGDVVKLLAKSGGGRLDTKKTIRLARGMGLVVVDPVPGSVVSQGQALSIEKREHSYVRNVKILEAEDCLVLECEGIGISFMTLFEDYSVLAEKSFNEDSRDASLCSR